MQLALIKDAILIIIIILFVIMVVYSVFFVITPLGLVLGAILNFLDRQFFHRTTGKKKSFDLIVIEITFNMIVALLDTMYLLFRDITIMGGLGFLMFGLFLVVDKDYFKSFIFLMLGLFLIIVRFLIRHIKEDY